MKVLGAFEKDKEALKFALEEVILILRDGLSLKSGAEKCLSNNRETAYRISSGMTSEKIMRAMDVVSETLGGIQYFANQNLLLARLSSRLK